MDTQRRKVGNGIKSITCLEINRSANICAPPQGFVHGFYVTSELAEFVYKCTDYYAPEHECTIIWNDPDLAIKWPLVNGQQPNLSAKDRKGLSFKQAGYFLKDKFVEQKI